VCRRSRSDRGFSGPAVCWDGGRGTDWHFHSHKSSPDPSEAKAVARSMCPGRQSSGPGRAWRSGCHYHGKGGAVQEEGPRGVFGRRYSFDVYVRSLFSKGALRKIRLYIVSCFKSMAGDVSNMSDVINEILKMRRLPPVVRSAVFLRFLYFFFSPLAFANRASPSDQPCRQLTGSWSM
jgi:hypothetical protein